MAPQRLILATRNEGKKRELAAPLARYGFQVSTPDPDLPEVEETGSSFEENALIKARALAALTGLPALADDSGLEVRALQGLPGVHSARYGDDIPFLCADESRDQRNTRKLLRALEGVPAPRLARFHCCMALVWPEGRAQGEREDLVTHGCWEGEIIEKPTGGNGFGYDPIFLDPLSRLTAAQLEPARKMERSHRARALAALLALLGDNRR